MPLNYVQNQNPASISGLIQHDSDLIQLMTIDALDIDIEASNFLV